MGEKGASLTPAFAAVSREMWLKALQESLTGAGLPLDTALARHTEDGIAFATLYTRADWPAGRSGVPGRMPFTRGRLEAESARAAWDIRAVVDHPVLAEAKRALDAEREGGAGSIALRLDATPAEQLHERAQESPWGLRLHRLHDVETLLGEADTSLALDAGAQALPFGLALIAWARKRKFSLRAELNVDPLAALAATGKLAGDIDDALATLGALAQFTAALDMNVSAVGVDTRVYHMAGAAEAQEIAFALATGAQYLRVLEAAGLSLDEAMHQFRFVFATDSRFFRSLTKLRAFRLCWGRLVEACGAPGGPGIWAETSLRDLSRRDPHTNLLRGVAGCFAAALGGADTISVRPYDEAQSVPLLFARRMARNTGLVLAEEGGLARVLDAAGGSFALESMTEAFAEKAWALFQEIESSGGMAAALASGKAAAMIAGVAKERARRIAAGELLLTGVTNFPDPDEEVPAATKIDWPALARAEKARTFPAPSADVVKRMKPGAKDRFEAAIEALRKGARFAQVGQALAGEGETVIAPLAPQRLCAPFERSR